ncbi:MAG: PAS domain-containing protein, partial [Anaerolineales bacterium]|nr:PAS domain-containing protein [Anaerolineales bacterium]
MSTKTQILLVDDVQQQLTHLAELIESHLDAQVTHHTVDHFEPSLSGVLGTTLTAALKPKHELVVFYVAENLAIDAIKVRSMVQSVTSQVILLLENPTVNQTVDLMNAGVAGIADWRDAERVIELIKEHIKTYPSFLMGSICQNIVDYQTELICRYDTNLRLLFVNRAYCEWRGLSAAELIGSSIIENIPLENQENAVAHVRALTRQHPIAVSIHPSVLPDGSLHIIEWTDRAIFNEEGDLAEYQGVGRDVTKREQQAAHLAEMYSELETYRSHMDAILDTMQDALLSMSLPDRETIFVSQSFENIFGYSHKHFTDDPEFFKQVIHPEDLEKSIAAQQQCLKNGFVELEHRIILADGQTRWLHRRGWVNYDENGRPIRINDS